jgi:hypothetical protein
MSNSKLISYTKISPNKTKSRKHSIDRITPHCVVGQLSAESIGNCFVSPTRKASCNYGIGTDGRVVLCVDEKDRSWCSSNSANDNRAVTIECASDKTAPYEMNNKVYNSLVGLCVDICRRNGKTKLLWISDKEKALKYSPKSDEMLITVHRWFANKACPGDWLYSRLGKLAQQVTDQLSGSAVSDVTEKEESTQKAFKVKVSTKQLRIRKGPGTNYGLTGAYTGVGTFTIVEKRAGAGSAAGWGRLQSGAGWIALDYVTEL